MMELTNEGISNAGYMHVPLPQSGVLQSEIAEHGKCWETILLVEDDPAVREVMRRILGMYGYTVLAANNADEGIRLFEEYEDTVSVLLTDVSMPGMDGRELACRLAERHPGLKTIFISGHSSTAFSVEAQGPNFAYLQKPFTLESLACKVREVIDGALYPADSVRVN